MRQLPNLPDAPRPRAAVRACSEAGAARWMAAAGLLAGALLAMPGMARAADAAGPAGQPVPVEEAAVARADVPVHLTGIGTVQAFNTVTIRTQVDGQLQNIAFVEGQSVKTGDLLAVIDPRLFQAALDAAIGKAQQDRAALANAETILNRDVQLGARDFASVQTVQTQGSTVDQLKAQIVQDDAAISRARTELSYTRITSPIDGRTGIRLVDVGNIVHPGDPTGIVVVTQLQPISVISTLPESDLAAVQEAQRAGPVQVAALANDGAVLDTGTLLLVNNEIAPASGTLTLKSTFPNLEGKLWPGQFVQVRLLAKTVRDAATVPSSALQRGPDGFFLYVIGQGDVVEPRAVQPGVIGDGKAVLEKGAALGERVVTAGQYRLAPGSRVTAQAGAPAGGTAAVATPVAAQPGGKD